jgi:hypothetical protein
MKVKRMGITVILRRIQHLIANKIKSSESVSKQTTQLIVSVEIRHNGALSFTFGMPMTETQKRVKMFQSFIRLLEVLGDFAPQSK